MLFIKRLDRFILGKFVLIFLGAFFICLFVFMMQFVWKFINDLVGKGLTIDILGRFFYYMGLTLMPTSLPLAVLLASLITFGNMGEQLELLAMKAAGISLIRIMLPIALFVTMLTGLSFYFQNSTSPGAQLKMRTLLFSMKATSPVLEIPEGVFYTDKIPNINLYVQEKNAETGMLYQVIIYKTDQGFDRAQIVLADSGKLSVTADKQHLKLRLWQGEMFENLQGQGTPGLMTKGVPYDRETFVMKDFVIDFDSNFKEMDAMQLAGMAQAKNMWQIEQSVDSMQHRLDSAGREYTEFLKQTSFRQIPLEYSDSITYLSRKKQQEVSFDKLFDAYAGTARNDVEQNAAISVAQQRADMEFRRDMQGDTEETIRYHKVEWHQKITLSLACIMFFFVGAPLGGIIRKGGLGMPTVISVAIFIIYYLINTVGSKLGKDGTINIVFGMWMSTIILMVIGLFLTYKSNKDSVVFNSEAYQRFFRSLIGIKPKRFLTRKEVIITDPNYQLSLAQLEGIKTMIANLQLKEKWRISYIQLFFSPREENETSKLSDSLEEMIGELANSQNFRVIECLNQFPQLFKWEHHKVSRLLWLNQLFGIIFPLGILLWIRVLYFRKKQIKNYQKILQISEQLAVLLHREIKENTQ